MRRNTLKQQTQYGELSERAVEILRLLADGLTDSEIAERLILTINTVKWYNRQIYSILGVNSRTQAIASAHERQLLAADNAAEVPSHSGAASPKHNLPAQPTRFIGRKREIGAVKRLLQTVRLLTMTGSPGTGKTRLAVQVACEVLFEFRDGVYLVPLAPLTDPDLLIHAIASALNLEDLGNQSVVETLKLGLRDKHMLLVLDNFEHMVSSAAIISELLSSAPDLKVLVTSREVLHLYGEQEYYVPPMSLPDPETHTDFSQYEAVELFVQQARSVRADFQLMDENALDVAKICIRLDGLPLAIELVAARIKLFSPHELLQRMGSGLETFTSSRRDVSARQQTLRHTLDWSYTLLDDSEKRLLAYLGVFASGWTLEAAEYVCRDKLNIDVLDGLASLVDKSLVRQETTPQNQTRFMMLRIIRDYAAQRLEETGDDEILRQRHAAYYIDFAERASMLLYDTNLGVWLNLLEGEHNNFRAILRWSLAGNPEPGLRLIHAIGTCWRIRGHLAEGFQWSQSLLEKSHEASPVIRSKALSTTSGMLACILGNFEDAEQMGIEALALAEASGDSHARAWAYFALGNARMVSDLVDARAKLEEAKKFFQEVGNLWGLARTLNSLGEVVRIQENYEWATVLYQDSLTLFRKIGAIWGESTALHNLAQIARNQGDFEHAQALFAQVLDISVSLNDKCVIADALGGLASVSGVLHQPQQAARLFGASEALREAINAHIQPGDRPDYERNLAFLHTELDEATFQTCWNEGRSLSLEQALIIATAQPTPA